MPVANGNSPRVDAIVHMGRLVRVVLKWMVVPVVLFWMLVYLIFQRMPFMLLGAVGGAAACLPMFFIYAIATGGDGLFTSHLEAGHWLHGWPFYVTIGIGALFGLLFPSIARQTGASIDGRGHSGGDIASPDKLMQSKRRETGSAAGSILWYLAYKQAKGKGSEGAENIKRAATGHGLKDWFDKSVK